MKFIILDLDSTLADTRHRLDCVPDEANGLSWWDYADRCLEDTPIAGTVVLSQLLHQAGIGVLILTARPMKAHNDTRNWLHKHHIYFTELRMITRSEFDATRDGHASLRGWKASVIKDYQKNGKDFILAIDDGVHAEEMYQQCDVPCLTVMSWYARDLLAEHPMMVGI